MFLGIFAVVTGCGGDGMGPPSGPDPARAEVTYWKDVAPILGARCLGCHQAGGVAPFRLDSYAEARLRAPLMAVAVQLAVSGLGSLGIITPSTAHYRGVGAARIQ